MSAEEAAEIEVVDAVPVEEAGRDVEVVRPPTPPVVRQAAAVAATGIVAGAVTVLAARHARGLPSRLRARRATRRRMAALPGPVVASRSFLVDVHVLAPRE
jgi:hypothetical protein